MRLPQILRKRMRSLVRWSRQEDELRAEMALHLEQLVKEHRREGMSLKEAELAARRDFGNEALLEEDARSSWGWSWLEDAAKDVAFGFRLLRKSPGFTVTAVVSLALGIGANTAIFSLMKQVLLDSLPVRNPRELVRVTRSTFENASMPSFSRPFLQDLQKADGIPYQGFLAITGMGRTAMMVDGSAEPVIPEAVSGNFFDLLGVRPALGRVLTEGDDRSIGGSPVAVLSYSFWQRRFGRDPSILNRTIRLNDKPFTVVGVSSAGFEGLAPGQTVDLRIPITMIGYPPQQLNSRGDWWLDVYGRLKPGTTLAAAGDALLPLLKRNYEMNPRRGVPSDYQRRVRESERMAVLPAMHGSGAPRLWDQALRVLMAMVACVLLLACVNIAHLLLARGSAREREHSVRAAIGASRGRLIRQQLTESLLLAALGGALGIAVAYGFTETLIRMMVTDREHSALRGAPDGWLLAFNFAVAVLAGVLFGLAPAIRASRSDLLGGSKGTLGTAVGRMATRKVLISVQIAISVVLLMGAALFSRTLDRFRHLDLGFRTDRLLVFELNPPSDRDQAVLPFFDQMRARIAAMPGVLATAASRQRLMAGNHWGSGIQVEGYVVPEGDRGPDRDAVTPGYFSAVGMALLSGREFEPGDISAGAPLVAVVNESFARQYFANQNPIGKTIGQGGQPPMHTVVGVVRDAHYAGLRDSAAPFWWVPLEELPPPMYRSLSLYVRTSGDAERLMTAIRSVVAATDKQVAVFRMGTLEMQLDNNLTIERLLATLSMFFAGLAALLAAVGLFGVLSYSVARREREIGIRMALGASPMDAGWTVVREVTLYVFAGLAAGVGAALLAGKVVEGFLFGVQARDSASLAVACLGMAAIALIAAAIPVRRAAGVAPAVAFRAE